MSLVIMAGSLLKDLDRSLKSPDVLMRADSEGLSLCTRIGTKKSTLLQGESLWTFTIIITTRDGVKC